ESENAVACPPCGKSGIYPSHPVIIVRPYCAGFAYIPVLHGDIIKCKRRTGFGPSENPELAGIPVTREVHSTDRSLCRAQPSVSLSVKVVETKRLVRCQ